MSSYEMKSCDSLFSITEVNMRTFLTYLHKKCISYLQISGFQMFTDSPFGHGQAVV